MITTVLTVFNRHSYLESQIESIKDQTIDSDIFLIWRNELKYNLEYPAIIYRNESNHFNSLYGRFYNSLHVTSPYVFVVDDDIMPGKRYLERCIEFSQKNNDRVVVCTYGVNFKEGETEYNVSSRYNPDVFLSKPTQVHMGGQGWFMKTELLKHFLYQPPIDLSTGEDLHFSFCLYKNNIPIYVLDKDKKDNSTWQDLELGKRGSDDKAQWRYLNHKPARDKLVSKYASLGWEFVNYKTNII